MLLQGQSLPQWVKLLFSLEWAREVYSWHNYTICNIGLSDQHIQRPILQVPILPDLVRHLLLTQRCVLTCIGHSTTKLLVFRGLSETRLEVRTRFCLCEFS